MHRISITTAAVFVALAAGPARADGLLYQLPEDGAWVRFDVKITSQRTENTRKERITMRSVGRMDDSNERCRWIEFKLPEEESTQITKVLIAEKYLKKGENPLDHVLRAWRKRGAGIPVSLVKPRGFWLLVLLAGPLDDVKKLESAVIDGPLGKLESPRQR